MCHFYLVTTYNHQRYFDAAFRSIQAQYTTLAEFHQQAQVLVVDDCSPDATPRLLETAGARHANVLVFVNPTNQGIGRNRNFLLNWAVSLGLMPQDMLLFVDGDDLLAPTHLRDKLALFEREPVLDCVGGQLGLFYGDKTTELSVVDTFSVDPEMQAIANIFECHFYVSNAMFRGRVFLDPAVRFPETPLGEDWLFFATYPMVKRHCPQVTLHYRRHDDNLTSRPVEQGLFVFRRTTRTLGLLKMGVHPSDRDCERLDLVSYLSFRLRWCGLRARVASCHMPWFSYLKDRPNIRTEWPAMRADVAGLFERMRDSNARIRGYDPVKLDAFLTALLREADAEVAQADVAASSAART